MCKSQKNSYITNEVRKPLPNKTWLHSADYNLSLFKDNLYEQFNVFLPNEIKHAVVKRRAEFLAGRYLLKKGLIDFNIFDYHAMIGINRQPILPKGILASISHTETKVYCAIKRNIPGSILGIDVENILNSDLAKEVKEIVITNIEEQYLNTLNHPFNTLLTIAFSAKESLFKSTYRFANKYFGFEYAEIYEINLANDTFTLRLQKDISPSLQKGHTFSGNFKIENNTIFTIISEVNTLVKVPPLKNMVSN